MFNLLLLLGVIPLAAWLNRVRGGGLGGQYLRGASDFWIAPPMAVLSWLCDVKPSQHASNAFLWLLGTLPDWAFNAFSTALDFVTSWVGTAAIVALLFALCWLSWSTPAWGTLYKLGFVPPVDRPGAWYERFFKYIAYDNLFIAFGLRMTIFLIPMALVFGWPWILLGPLMVGAYTLGWKYSSTANAIQNAELMTGALWGSAFALSLLISRLL